MTEAKYQSLNVRAISIVHLPPSAPDKYDRTINGEIQVRRYAEE